MRSRAAVSVAFALAACSGSKEPPHADKPPEKSPDQVHAETTVRTLCSTCHLQPGVGTKPAQGGAGASGLVADVRTPSLETLRKLPPAAIVIALEFGVMRDIGMKFSPAQRIAIAEHITGGKYDPTGPTGHYCAPGTSKLEEDLAGPSWPNWGNDLENTRFQPGPVAKLAAADLPRLQLKWAYELVQGRAGSVVTVHGSRMYFGDQAGKVRAMNRATGCTYWVFDAGRWMRTAIQFPSDGKRTLACFGATQFPASYYCVDAATGAKVWQTELLDHPMSYVSTAAVLHDGTFYVPISVGRESHRAAPDPKYECCTGRGALIALEAATGKIKWKTFTTDEPKPTVKTEAGTQMWGPSGASIWTAPLADTKLGRIYAITGNNSSMPVTKTSDAMLAFDMKTGAIVWSFQLTTDDVWNDACMKPDGSGAKGNCPWMTRNSSLDPTTPLLKTLPDGRRMLLVADKTGRVFALDPDKNGKVVWQRKVSPGGNFGGVHWGLAADDEHLYIPLHDRAGYDKLKFEYGRISGRYEDRPDAGSMVALRLSDGSEVWRVTPPGDRCAGKPEDLCSGAFSSAPTVIPGAVLAGAIDGHVRAFSAKDGTILWDFDTVREFDTVNGQKAKGGAIDGPGGIVVVDGQVIVSSGYGAYSQMPGNVLLTFTVDGK